MTESIGSSLSFPPVPAPAGKEVKVNAAPASNDYYTRPPGTASGSRTKSAHGTNVNGVQGKSKAPTGQKRKFRHLNPEEEKIAQDVAAKIPFCAAADHISAVHPDVDTPFADAEDVVNRLLPYHIFQYPKEDYDVGGKGKRKATEADLLREEIAETKFALKCHKRVRKLENRFRRVRIQEGKRKAPDAQAYWLEQVVLDAERADTAALNVELRNARAEQDRIEREKRAQAIAPVRNTVPNNAGAPTSTTTYSQSPYTYHYRGYSYPYSQPYNQSYGQSYSQPYSQSYGQSYSQAYNQHYSQSGTQPYNQMYPPPYIQAAGSSTNLPVQPSASTNTSQSQSSTQSSIPVQIPVASLPQLQRIGINPVLPTTTPAGQAAPPAIIRGYTSNGTMLDLEVNVHLLHAAQMNGLALLLNSLMAAGATATNPLSSLTPAAAQAATAPSPATPGVQSMTTVFSANEGSTPTAGGR